MNKLISYIFPLLLLLFSTAAVAQPVRPFYKLHYDKSSQPAGTKLYINDSTVYVYVPSSMRGSTTMCDTVHFDSLKVYTIDPSSLKATLVRIDVREYDANDQLLKQTYYTKDVGGWKEIIRYEWTYMFGLPASYKIFEDLYDNNSGNFYYGLEAEYKYSYNTKSQIRLIDVYSYTGNYGQPLQHSSKIFYLYGANGKWADSTMNNIGGVWKHAKQIYYLYDNNGNMVQADEYSVSGVNTKSLTATQYYFYNAQGQRMGDSVRTDIPNRPSDPKMHFYTRDVSGKITGETYIMPKSTNIKYNYSSFSYNSMGYIEKVESGRSKTVSYDGLSDSTMYYYSWTPTGVPQSSAISLGLILYPNPASNLLYLNTQHRWEMGSIYNSQGQLVQQVNLPVTVIDISTLPVGNYYLQLFGGGRISQQSFVVSR